MTTHVNALAVMAKAPLAGQVKTRLLPALTAPDAADLSRALLVDQLTQLQELDVTDFYLVFAPNEARSLMTELAPPCFCLLPQQGDDLGARMAAVFAELFSKGPQKYRPYRRGSAAGSPALLRRGLRLSRKEARCLGAESRWGLLSGRLQSTDAANFPQHELEP
jgi:Uncharacterized protein conserved in bacteria (DUF2064)